MATLPAFPKLEDRSALIVLLAPLATPITACDELSGTPVNTTVAPWPSDTSTSLAVPLNLIHGPGYVVLPSNTVCAAVVFPTRFAIPAMVQRRVDRGYRPGQQFLIVFEIAPLVLWVKAEHEPNALKTTSALPLDCVALFPLPELS
jgi:hypothetical protein